MRHAANRSAIVAGLTAVLMCSALGLAQAEPAEGEPLINCGQPSNTLVQIGCSPINLAGDLFGISGTSE